MPEHYQTLRRLKELSWTIAIGIFAMCPAASGQINPYSQNAEWVPILYDTNSVPDPSQDQQTGSPESDIVGNLNNPSFYMQYGGDYLGFRLRLAGDVNPPGFKGCAFVGMDLNLDGAVDLFVGVNNQGSHDQIGIWLPGLGANDSPATTSIGSLVHSYSETTLNYSFSPVSSLMNSVSLSYDQGGPGQTEQFLTFYVRADDVASVLAAEGITFTGNSLMNFVVATSTQPNKLNQDINGVNGGINSTLSWTALGAFSLPYTPLSGGPVNIDPIPEASQNTFCCLMGGTALLQLVLFRRRS